MDNKIDVQGNLKLENYSYQL